MTKLPFPKAKPIPNVKPFVFTKEHRDELESLLCPRKSSKSITNDVNAKVAGQIEELREAAELERFELEWAKSALTLSDEKRGLKLAAKRALDFRDVLKNAPPEPMLTIDSALIMQKHISVQKEDLLKFLSDFAKNIEVMISLMPKQNPRRSNSYLIAKIARICGNSGITPSVSPTSRFFQICATLFSAIGVQGNKRKVGSDPASCDPKGSIDSYLRYAGGNWNKEPLGASEHGSDPLFRLTSLFIDSRRQSPIATWLPASDGEA
jgi:hypothetical protein